MPLLNFVCASEPVDRRITGRIVSHRKAVYRLAGRIVARNLPHGTLNSESLVKRDSNANRMKRPTNLHATSGRQGGGFISAGPSEISVESDAILELRIRAISEDEAVDIARTKHAEPLAAALMIATGQPAHIELLRIAEEREDGSVDDQGWSVMSDHAFVCDCGPMNRMNQSDQGALVEAVRTMRRDQTAGLAASDLTSASQLQWTAGGRVAGLESSALRFFLVIERVAKRVASDRPPEPDEIAKRNRVVSELTRDLNSNSSTSSGTANARRVLNAAEELFDGSTRSLSEDIRFTCELLSISDDLRDVALNLTKLRNQSLAHPRGKATRDPQIAARTELAAGAARAFLGAYIQTSRPQ